MIKRGDIPAFKVVHNWRVKRADLETYIREQHVQIGLFSLGATFYRPAREGLGPNLE